jgi:hypothetical protein
MPSDGSIQLSKICSALLMNTLNGLSLDQSGMASYYL